MAPVVVRQVSARDVIDTASGGRARERETAMERVLTGALLCMCLAALYLGPCHAEQQPVANAEINSVIDHIENDRSVSMRTELAMQLALIIQRAVERDHEAIEVDTIERLSRLLDDREDSVRFGIVTALGSCGPAAVRTVPRLRAALKEAEFGGSVNRSGSSTSADAIAAALEKLKVCVPTPGPDLRARCNYLIPAQSTKIASL
jgi:hypothetical protein